MNRMPATNSRFAKAGLSCFYDSEVLNSSFVHLMKFSAENPRLRKAAKRYQQFSKKMMKTKILILSTILVMQLANAQLKNKYTEIRKLFPNSKSNGLRSEGSFLVEDLYIDNEVKKMIIYNKDSIAVGIGNSDKKLIDKITFDKIILNELPNFKTSKSAIMDTKIYYYDEKNNYLIISNSASDRNEFPLKSFIIIIEPRIIEIWIKNIDNWK